jgi:hypothetical protein
MASVFQSTRASLDAQFNEASLFMEYVSVSLRMRPAMGAALNWQHIDGSTKKLAQDFMQFRELNLNAVYNGLFAVTMAAFEDFLRKLLRTVIRERASHVGSFSELGENAVNLHFKASGRLLSRLHDQPDYLHVDLFEVARRLGTCREDARDFELNEDAIIELAKLTNLEQLLDLIDQLGLKLSLDGVVTSGDLQALLGASGTRQTSKELQKTLREAVKTRNRIAHSGSVPADVTPESLITLIRFLRELADSIVKALEDAIATM